MSPEDNASITSKHLNRNPLPITKLTLLARNLTTPEQNTCWTSGNPTVMNLQLQTNTGTGGVVHNYMCKRVLYSAECAMQLFSAAATARVRLSHQHANPVLRITNQSSGRWVTLTVLEPCRNSPQLPGVCAVLSYRLHTLTQTNVRWPDPRLLHAFWQQWLSA